MKKTLRVLFIVILFLAIGEAVIRFDQATLFFQDTRFQQLENRPMESRLLEEIDAGRFVCRDEQFRVMLLGDSFLYQGRWPSDVAFAPVLENRLQNGPLGDDRDVQVLDLFVPGTGPNEARDRYFNYAARFRPHVVFWAYNRNDVMQVELERAETAPTGAVQPAPAKTMGWRDRYALAVYSLKRNLTRHVRVAAFVNRNLTQQLKARGIILPGSRFRFILNRSHHPDYAPWQRTQEIVAEVEENCTEQGTRLVVMITPLLNILPYYDLVATMDEEMQTSFEELGADGLNGVEPFLEDPDGRYSISRYDEHPNDTAHQILAAYVADQLARLSRDESLPSRDTGGSP